MSHDTMDLEEFYDALSNRMQVEVAQIEQLQTFLHETKKSVMTVTRQRDAVRKELLISRKQV
jgi:hypothetical protein